MVTSELDFLMFNVLSRCNISNSVCMILVDILIFFLRFLSSVLVLHLIRKVPGLT